MTVSPGKGKRSREERPQRPLVPSAGAHRSFAEMTQTAMPIPTESFHPKIYPCTTETSHISVLPPVSSTSTSSTMSKSFPPVSLVRTEPTPTQAFAYIPDKPAVQLSHHSPNWGCVLWAVAYPVVSTNAPSNSTIVVQVPTRRQAQLVAIKRLNKAAVHSYLQAGGEENPYKEICRMEELGDNRHVLRHMDALEDDEFLYIITPYATGGSLLDKIPFLQAELMDSTEAHALFCQILRILAYLERHLICHRDLSPDNFLFLTPHQLVVFDLALSHRLPVNAQRQRCLCHPGGNFGTRAYMAPELYANRVFCGIHTDLWSATTILYNMLTNQFLYHQPIPADLLFRYNILARAVSSERHNERTVEVLQDALQEQDSNRSSPLHQQLMDTAMAHLNLTDEAIEVLEHVFRPNPMDRWTLAQTIESSYVQNRP